jgi:transcriptional regulator with XRE-family HTH domain
MDIRKVFAENLRAARTEKRISQEELADRAKIDRTYVSSLERCAYSASITMVAKLAKALGREPWELLLDASRTDRAKQRR